MLGWENFVRNTLFLCLTNFLSSCLHALRNMLSIRNFVRKQRLLTNCSRSSHKFKTASWIRSFGTMLKPR